MSVEKGEVCERGGWEGEGERVGRFMCEERTCLWKE